MRRCLLVAAGVAFGFAGMVLSAETEKDNIILLTNDVCRLELHPQKGGICAGFEIKDKDFEFKLQPPVGLFREVFTRPAMEGQGSNIQFGCQVKGGGADGMQVELTAKLDAANADEAVAGMELKRVMKLLPGKRWVEVSQVVKNGTSDVMGLLMGTRQQFIWDEVVKQGVVFLPTEKNVLRESENSIGLYYIKPADWEYQVAAGWMAVLSPRSKLGLVFVLDEKYVDSFYCKSVSGVSGWFMDGGILNPGSALETGYLVVPVKGFDGISYASRRMIADVQVKAAGAGMLITHVIAGARDALGDVELKVSVYGVRSKTTKVLAPLKIQNVGVDPTVGTITIDQPQSEPIVVRVAAAGKDWQENYEAYHEGEFRCQFYPGYPYIPEYRRQKIKR